MLDVSVAYNRYKFLGYEFLTWLWFTIENDFDRLRKSDNQIVSLEIGNRIALENRRNDAKETITIKGDDAGLEEGLLALKKGAQVTEMNLAYKTGELEWFFTIKGENLNLSNLKLPATVPVENKDDIEGALIEKAYLYEMLFGFTDRLFTDFITLRVSDEWKKQVAIQIKRWILR
ncbi:hypothetical protein QUF75_14480 [Desulfococcaceae bacterium HSG7]|nr:hypothetical protein [Desulfococcaceae bacterium HSG7]